MHRLINLHHLFECPVPRIGKTYCGMFCCKLGVYYLETRPNVWTFLYVSVSGAQTFWLVGHICLSDTLRRPQEL